MSISPSPMVTVSVSYNKYSISIVFRLRVRISPPSPPPPSVLHWFFLNTDMNKNFTKFSWIQIEVYYLLQLFAEYAILKVKFKSVSSKLHKTKIYNILYSLNQTFDFLMNASYNNKDFIKVNLPSFFSIIYWIIYLFTYLCFV